MDSVYKMSGNVVGQSISLANKDGHKVLVDRSIYLILLQLFKGHPVQDRDLAPEEWKKAEEFGLISEQGSRARLTRFAQEAFYIRDRENRL